MARPNGKRPRAGSGRKKYIVLVDPAPAPEGAPYEPGVPSLRAMLPSIIFGAAVPLLVYNLVRSHVHSEAQALIIAGVFPVLWVVFNLIRTRQVDFIGVIVLLGFVIGVVTSTLMGGNSYVLKARDSAFTAIFGLVCLVSIVTRGRPTIFFVGRYLSAGNDPEKKEAFDELHELPTGQRTFRVLTLVWGVGLLVEAGVRLVLADSSVLPTNVFLAVSPVVSGICIGAMFIFTVLYSNRARAKAQILLGQADAPGPPIPLP